PGTGHPGTAGHPAGPSRLAAGWDHVVAVATTLVVLAVLVTVPGGCGPAGTGTGRAAAGDRPAGGSGSGTAPPVRSTRATSPAPVHPPYPVAEVTVALVDTSRPTVSGGDTISPHRALTTLVWSPAVPGRWPLVVFGHGFQVGPPPYETLLRSWAAAGFVVAAPEFPLTDEAVAGASLDENDIQNQPADVRFVADALIATASPLSSHIDPTRVAVAGHSDGAATALDASITTPPPGMPAFRAVIAMSVAPLIGLSSTGNPPILVTQGDADTVNDPSLGYQTWDRAASPKYLDVLRGGSHLAPLEAGSAWLPGIEAVTVAFLDAFVAGDGPVSAIAAAGASSPGLASLRSG
ncbi:MAG: alpha/beta hydrolase family protein, partial [Acidimicrobiales bacterium]